MTGIANSISGYGTVSNGLIRICSVTFIFCGHSIVAIFFKSSLIGKINLIRMFRKFYTHVVRFLFVTKNFGCSPMMHAAFNVMTHPFVWLSFHTLPGPPGLSFLRHKVTFITNYDRLTSFTLSK